MGRARAVQVVALIGCLIVASCGRPAGQRSVPTSRATKSTLVEPDAALTRPTVEATTTTFSGRPDQLANCIIVDSRSTSDVGCELKTDFLAASPNPRLPGVPVYADTGSTPGAVVGYIVTGIDQFVPLALTRDPATLSTLKVCNQEMLARQPLDAGCESLLEQMGTQPGFFPPGSSLPPPINEPTTVAPQ